MFSPHSTKGGETLSTMGRSIICVVDEWLCHVSTVWQDFTSANILHCVMDSHPSFGLTCFDLLTVVSPRHLGCLAYLMSHWLYHSGFSTDQSAVMTKLPTITLLFPNINYNNPHMWVNLTEHVLSRINFHRGYNLIKITLLFFSSTAKEYSKPLCQIPNLSWPG